ncbi:MAG: hypothetical protein GX974_01950, partial [Clostridiales bacterium]|nr:hypothetical protein [Clostridiales bacterium]
MEYLAFTDESSVTEGRFRSLSTFTFPFKYYTEISNAIFDIIQGLGIKEFKWNKLKNGRYYNCAKELLNFLFANIYRYDIRMDIMIWDIYDTRHNIMGRDDLRNYERMFFHLLKYSIEQRPKHSIWHIRPDVMGGIDWDTLHDYLSNIGGKYVYQMDMFIKSLRDSNHTVKSLDPSKSHEELPIQIADFFSGLSIFSREHYSKYLIWQERSAQMEQMTILEFKGQTNIDKPLSNSERYRSK